MRKDGAMPVEASELSSLASLLEQLTRRVTAMAEDAAAAKDDDASTELFGIERALSGASRRLGRLLESERSRKAN